MKQSLVGLGHLVFLFVLSVGCGGSASTEPEGTGRVTLTIQWPATRDIPAATRSIKVVAKVLEPPNGPQVGEVVVPRPENASSSQAVLDNLPSVKVRLTATAHASNDGTGAVIATGSTDVTVVANSTVSPSIDLGPASNVNSVYFEDEDFIAIGHDTTFHAFAEDSNGAPVAVDPSDWLWTVTGPATVTPSAQTALLRGTDEGQATVTLRHIPSDKFSQRTYLVAACSEYTTTGGAGAGGATFNVSAYENTATATGRIEWYVDAPGITGDIPITIDFRGYIEDETTANPIEGSVSLTLSWPAGSDSESGSTDRTFQRFHQMLVRDGQRITMNASASANAGGADVGISGGFSSYFINIPGGVNVRLLQCPDDN